MLRGAVKGENRGSIIIINKDQRFTENYKKYRRELLGFLFSETGNHETAEDILQDVYLRLFLRMSSLKEDFNQDFNQDIKENLKEESVRPWLYSTAKNILLENIRRDYSEAQDLFLPPPLPEDPENGIVMRIILDSIPEYKNVLDQYLNESDSVSGRARYRKSIIRRSLFNRLRETGITGIKDIL